MFAGSAGECGFGDGPAATARFGGPADMVSDGAGNLYVSDPPNHVVRKIVLGTGIVSTVVGTPATLGGLALGPLPASLNWPGGLALAPGAGLFIADSNENAILHARW